MLEVCDWLEKSVEAHPHAYRIYKSIRPSGIKALEAEHKVYELHWPNELHII